MKLLIAKIIAFTICFAQVSFAESIKLSGEVNAYLKYTELEYKLKSSRNGKGCLVGATLFTFITGGYGAFGYAGCFNERPHTTADITNTDADIKLSYWGKAKEKIRAQVSFEGQSGCAGFSINFIGEGDGFGGFNLFKNKDDYSKNNQLGELVVFGDEISLNFPEDLNVQTPKDTGSTCFWTISKKSPVVFDNSTPSKTDNSGFDSDPDFD